MDFWVQICCVLSDKLSFEVFSPMWSHVNENEKKIISNQKCKVLKINSLDISWKGTVPPNLALIRLTGSEKTGFTDDGRTNEQLMEDGRPRDGSSAAVQ